MDEKLQDMGCNMNSDRFKHRFLRHGWRSGITASHPPLSGQHKRGFWMCATNQRRYVHIPSTSKGGWWEGRDGDMLLLSPPGTGRSGHLSSVRIS